MSDATAHNQPTALGRPNRHWLRDPGHFIALGGGSGLAPVAPGTFGSIVGVGLYLLLAPWPLWVGALVVVACFGLGIWLCGRTARALGVADPSAIVWDEIVAVPIALCGALGDPTHIVLGFALFRLFDIWKPWPISWADQQVKGGLGIMLDDLGAALLAAGVLAFWDYFP
jgi:phosphatidylglycerophosphatase A